MLPAGIFMHCITVALAPTKAALPTCTCPHSTAETAICEKSSILLSCSTNACVFIIHARPTYESAFTISFFPIIVPSPTLAVDEMIAEGSLITGNSNPICFNVSYIVSLIYPLPR